MGGLRSRLGGCDERREECVADTNVRNFSERSNFSVYRKRPATVVIHPWSVHRVLATGIAKAIGRLVANPVGRTIGNLDKNTGSSSSREAGRDQRGGGGATDGDGT